MSSGTARKEDTISALYTCAIESDAYYKDLLMLYVFTAIGAVPVIKNQIKGK